MIKIEIPPSYNEETETYYILRAPEGNLLRVNTDVVDFFLELGYEKVDSPIKVTLTEAIRLVYTPCQVYELFGANTEAVEKLKKQLCKNDWDHLTFTITECPNCRSEKINFYDYFRHGMSRNPDCRDCGYIFGYCPVCNRRIAGFSCKCGFATKRNNGFGE